MEGISYHIIDKICWMPCFLSGWLELLYRLLKKHRQITQDDFSDKLSYGDVMFNIVFDKSFLDSSTNFCRLFVK